MKTSRIFLLVGLVSIFVFSSLVHADVPQMINYQGKITTPAGALIDSTLSMVFSIYDNQPDVSPVWAETLVVQVEKGIFSVLLGNVHPIPYNLFDGTVKYLGVKAGDDPEMTPRKEIVSVAYAYRAATVQSGGIDCSDCDDRFVNVLGPDGVYASSGGSALEGRNSGSSLSEIRGVEGSGENTSSGEAIGGHFEAQSAGEGNHYGVKAFAHGSSSAYTYGVRGYGDNTSTGFVYGGRFVTSSSGTGNHYGVDGHAYASNANVFAVSGWAYGPDSESATVEGGSFYAFADGPGLHYGVYAQGQGTSGSTSGVRARAINYSTGNAYGGYFSVDDTGTGTHYGVYASEEAGGSGAAVYASGDYGGSGAKYAVVRTSRGNRVLSVIESPEVWFEDFGEGQLVNGQAHIELDPLFLETVTIDASNPMKVFIQLNDPDCKGTAVIRATTDFRVVELDNGTSNASFSYRLVAKRKGYENQRLKQTDIGMEDPHLYPELFEVIESARRAEDALIEQERQRMKEEDKESSRRDSRKVR